MMLLLLACATEAPTQAVDPSTDLSVDSAEAWESTDCKTSCSLGDATDEVHLTVDEVAFWMEEWNGQPIGQSTEALDTLLFYGPDTEKALAELDLLPLDDEHRDFLQRELARDEVIVEMRLLDEDGVERGHMGPERIPLKEKQHLVFAGTGALKHLETGGKVKRVGLGHLWSRW